MLQYVVRTSVCLLSVRLSVTFGYVCHTRWNTSKIISRLISLRHRVVVPLIARLSCFMRRRSEKSGIRYELVSETCQSTSAYRIDLNMDSSVFRHSTAAIFGLYTETVEVSCARVQRLRVSHITYYTAQTHFS